MAPLETFTSHPGSDRRLFALELASADDWPDELDLGSTHFVLLLACDPRRLDDEDIEDLARKVLNQGAAYIALWGPDCERVHDVFDEVIEDWDPESTADSVVQLEWHDDDSFAEAVWLAIHSDEPAPAYEKTCGALLAAVIGAKRRSVQVRVWLDDPEVLDVGREDDEPL